MLMLSSFYDECNIKLMKVAAALCDCAENHLKSAADYLYKLLINCCLSHQPLQF